MVYGESQTVTGSVYGDTYYYLYNDHGDVIALTDEQGNIVTTYEYDEWGNLISQTGNITNPYLYAGYRYDSETGLYYLIARYYDPVTGRFLSKDPVEGIEGDTQSLNPYAYALNNPMNLTDPDGEWVQVAVGAAGGAAWSALKYTREVYQGQRKYSAKSAALIIGTGAVMGATGKVAQVGVKAAKVSVKAAVKVYTAGRNAIVNYHVSKYDKKKTTKTKKTKKAKKAKKTTKTKKRR